jgi:hypothetical protein
MPRSRVPPRRAQVLDTFRCFLSHATAHGGSARKIVGELLSQLGSLEATLQRSPLFAESELIGTSLLLSYDGRGRVGLWVMDFGLSCTSPTGPLRHDAPWTVGNHEDGYLVGMASMQRLFHALLESGRF